MSLINNYRAPGAKLVLHHTNVSIEESPNYAMIGLRHIDLLILKESLPAVLAASTKMLLAKQFAEKPSRIGQHGDAVNGLFWYCAPPSSYDDWGMNEQAEQWMYSFCRPDDFGNLVPADPFYHGSEDEQFAIF